MRNFTIGRVWGIPIRINISLILFLPVLAWLIGSGQQIEVYAGIVEGFTGTPLDVATLRANVTPWLIGGAAAIGLFVSVAIHELGHSWVAMRYGLTVQSITLWLLGGLASLERMPREWNREFWIAIAGPITSLLVGGVCYAVATVTPVSLQAVVFVFGWLAVTNLVLAAFNMLPAFPMDGGRILRALLARSRPYPSATRTAARVGSLFAIAFVVLGVLAFSPLLLLLAVFLYFAASTESRMVQLDALLEGLTVADVRPQEDHRIDADRTVADLLDRIVRDRRTEYVVTDDGQITGVVTLGDLQTVAEGERATRTVGEVASTPTISVGMDDDAFEVLSELSGSKSNTAFVERDGRVVGVVTTTDFTSVLNLLKARGPEGAGMVRVAR